MKFITFNTKMKQEFIYDESEVIDLFECDSWRENHQLKEEYDEFMNNITDYIGEDEDVEQAKKDHENYWHQLGREVYEDKTEYLKDMIEYETWTSPCGVISVFKVTEIIK